MAELNLTQAEADALVAMEKHRIDENEWDYPGLGGSICIPLISPDRRENFLLDVSRGRLDLLKGTYQKPRTADRGARPVGFRWATSS